MCHAVTGLDSSVCQGVSRGVFPRPETKLLDVFSQIMKAFVSSSLGNCSGLSGNAPFKRGETARLGYGCSTWMTLMLQGLSRGSSGFTSTRLNVKYFGVWTLT